MDRIENRIKGKVQSEETAQNHFQDENVSNEFQV